MKTTPQLGGDPEFFIYIKNGKKYNIISADKAGLPGKQAPAIFDVENNRAFFDGVQAEINFRQDPCREVITGNIRSCLYGVLNLVREKLNVDSSIHFIPIASAEVTPEVIKDTDRECSRFGCSPDMSIYERKKIKYPNGKRFMTRFSGGHTHIGLNGIQYMSMMEKPDKLLNLLKILDIIPGVVSVCLAQTPEEKIRRQWYGQAGTYRVQPHGIEYRTLSSFWLTSPQLVSIMYGLVRDAFTLTYFDKEKDIIDSVSETEIQKIIDSCDTKKAIDIWNSIIKPIYKKNKIENTPFTNDLVIEFMDKMMLNKGYISEFNPNKTLNYWGLRSPSLCDKDIGWSRTFGIVHFLQEYDEEIMRKIQEEE